MKIEVMNTNNINSFNRLSISDGIEGGQSLTAGLDYKLKIKMVKINYL